MSSQDNLLAKYSWIDFNLFRRILNKEFTVTNINRFEIQPALQNGENYSSFLLRAIIEYTVDGSDEMQKKYFIIKTSLGSQLIRSRNVFAKEIFIYKNIVPRIQNVLRIENRLIQLTPKYYEGNLEKSYLILEDMSATGCMNIDRRIGLNVEQLRLCLKTIAKWHAASTKIVDNESMEILELYMKPHVSSSGSPHYRILFENAISSCADAFEKHPELQTISDKLKMMKDDVFKKCCAAVRRDENGFNVLTHGDLWSNNIFFNHQNDSNAQPILIDFQVSYYGSAILDISYLLFISSNSEITSDQFDELISQYFEELIETMTKLNVSKIPDKKHLQTEFQERGCYGAFFSMFSVPMRIVDNATNDEVKKFLSNSSEGLAFRKQLYSNEEAQKILTNLLKYFDRKGFFN